MSSFNQYTQLLDLGELRDICLREGELRRYDRGDVFSAEGEVCGEIGLILRGYFKYVVRDTAGVECVAGFALKDGYVTYFNSIVCNTPSPVSIVAGRVSEILVIPAARAMALPGFAARVVPVLFEIAYGRILDGYRYTARERYEQLCAQYPEVFQIIPLREIASYLRVTPVHLSRIRRRALRAK